MTRVVVAPFTYFIALLLVFTAQLTTMGYSCANYSIADSEWQSDKDRRVFEKLERELRKELDELLSESPSAKVVQLEGTIVRSSYDRFKDETTSFIELPVSIPLAVLNGSAITSHIYAGYSYSGQLSINPASMTLILRTYGTVLFGNNPSLIFLANGRRLKIGNMQQRVESAGRDPIESVSADIPYDVFIALANSDLVEVQ